MKNKGIVKDYVIITISMFVVSAAIYYLMMPNGFVIGSLSGMIMVLAHFVPLKVSTMTLIANVALLIVGYIFIGKDFGTKTVVTSLMLPFYLRIFEIITPNVPSLTDDMLVNMFCHVLVISFGQALLFNANASSGGLDVIAKLLNKYFHMEIGKSLTIAGFVAASTSILVYDRKTLVVSLLGTYLSGMILDSFIDGFHIRKRVCILSEKYQDMQKYIVEELNRGATLYPAFGGLDNQERTEVVTILEKNEYAKLLAYIHKTDPSAFVTVSTVGEVIGQWNEHKKERLRNAQL